MGLQTFSFSFAGAEVNRGCSDFPSGVYTLGGVFFPQVFLMKCQEVSKKNFCLGLVFPNCYLLWDKYSLRDFWVTFEQEV